MVSIRVILERELAEETESADSFASDPKLILSTITKAGRFSNHALLRVSSAGPRKSDSGVNVDVRVTT